MAITLKLNSGGFVRCLTRSDLELTKKKIPIATKQLNYTDHKHFLKKTQPSKHHHWLLALWKREQDSYSGGKIFILNGGRKESEKRPHFQWICHWCISSHCNPLCFPSSCLKGAWRGWLQQGYIHAPLGQASSPSSPPAPLWMGFSFMYILTGFFTSKQLPHRLYLQI